MCTKKYPPHINSFNSSILPNCSAAAFETVTVSGLYTDCVTRTTNSNWGTVFIHMCFCPKRRPPPILIYIIQILVIRPGDIKRNQCIWHERNCHATQNLNISAPTLPTHTATTYICVIMTGNCSKSSPSAKNCLPPLHHQVSRYRLSQPITDHGTKTCSAWESNLCGYMRKSQKCYFPESTNHTRAVLLVWMPII